MELTKGDIYFIQNILHTRKTELDNDFEAYGEEDDQEESLRISEIDKKLDKLGTRIT